MKKTIKKASNKSISAHKKNVTPSNIIKDGYRENVYNHEQQKAYQKSDAAKNNKENTAGPED